MNNAWSFNWNTPTDTPPETFGAKVGPWVKRGDSWERTLAGTIVAECYPGAFQFCWTAASINGYAKNPEDAMASADAALADARMTHG